MKTIRGITGILLAGLTAVVALLFLPTFSFSEITFTPLESIDDGLNLPGDVSISQDGTVYVVDGYQNLIAIYDDIGNSVDSIQISNPTSVAISTNNLIYVGTNDNFQVKILDRNHNVVGALGSGANEFELPRNITIDKATGNVYVVDQLSHSIKIYSQDGSFLSEIDDYPNLPQDVTILNNEIYVIDHPLMTGSWGGQIRGAKVRVFDMNGNELRSFGTYGDGEGQFVRPAGITSDTDGILYITDSFHGVVLCFDASGEYLGAIYNADDPMVTPMGIAIGDDRRLFVASLNTSDVHVFGLEGYRESIHVTPTSLTFTAEEGQDNPPQQVLTITNVGSEQKIYTASKDKDWLVLINSSVTIDSGNTGQINVGVNTSGLSVGTYTGQVVISDGLGASKSIMVTLEVTMPAVQPVLNITPEDLTFTYYIGGNLPPVQTITIELENDNGTTNWIANSDVEWIDISPMNGQGNSVTVVNINVDPTDLDPGEYHGFITVEASGAENSPATIMVTFIIKYSGTIEVNCNIDEASFTIKGPNDIEYEGNGQNWAKNEVPDGTYIITYNLVTGYKTPLSETKELTGGGTIVFEGNYESLAMSANIVVSRGADYQDDPEIGIFDQDGTLLFSFIPFVDEESENEEGYSFWLKYIDRLRKPKDRIGVNTAIGDINGDGKADIIVGRGPYFLNKAEIAAYNSDGTYINGSRFVALNTRYGVNVAVADFDMDGKVEVVVGAGPFYWNPSQVRIFTFDSGTFVDTGINFNAFDLRGGVNVATGDIDGDNIPELITAAGSSFNSRPEVKVWKINTSDIPWSIVKTNVDFVAFDGIDGIYDGANITTGDLNGDGIDEIIVGSGPSPLYSVNKIKVYNGDGTEFGLEIVDGSRGYGLKLASGDLDEDGIAEIIVGLGPFYMNPSIVKVYKADGTLLSTFDAFIGSHRGAPVSVGDLGY